VFWPFFSLRMLTYGGISTSGPKADITVFLPLSISCKSIEILASWRYYSICCSWFPHGAQYFGDLRTVSGDFFYFSSGKLKACNTFISVILCFYFRSIGPTDLENVPHVLNPMLIICTRFEADTTISYLFIAFLLLILYVSWPLTFSPLIVHDGSRGQPLYQVWRSYLSVLELWVMTSPVMHHWQCVWFCSHCGCTVWRDLYIWANISHIFEIPGPDITLQIIWLCHKDKSSYLSK